MSNRDNPGIGARFQNAVKEWFNNHFEQSFIPEVKIKIGSTLTKKEDYKDHKFDIVSDDQTIAIECKCITWTQSGNVPSAKMGFVNEAAFYLSLLPNSYKKYIVILDSYNPKRDEKLADYYYKTNKHLLGDIVVAEYSPEKDEMRFLC